MKNQLITLLVIFLGVMVQGNAQNYSMSNGTITTCSGTFLDNGGLGLYGNNQNITQTFSPSTPGRVIQIAFTTFQTQMGFDVLCIYDGPTTASPFLGCYSGTGTLNGRTFKSTHPSGSLTFVFTSNGSQQNNGWSATISCQLACQAFTANGDSVSSTPDTSALRIIRACRGETISFFGDASYPNSGTSYNQSNSTSTFTWKLGDGFSTPGQNITHTFNSNGIFDVHLVVEDTLLCREIDHSVRVIISDVPSFSQSFVFPNDTICLEDTALIVAPTTYIPYQTPVLNNAGLTPLPDGTGVSFFDTINVTIFDNAATYQAGFLEEIYLNIEHSYLGDLDIQLTCPNGQTTVLKTNPGGGNTFLGEPVDPAGIFPTPLNPGVGYTYGFTNINPRYNTMTNEANVHQYSYTDVLGNNYINEFYLPAGTYTPFQNMNTQFAGCPMNGRWILRVRDNIGIDDGNIFFWGVRFDTLIRPPNVSTTITSATDTSYWNTSANIIARPNDSTAVLKHTAPGNYTYTFTVIDNFGCTHDTTIDIVVKPKPKSNAGIDFTTCLLTHTLAPVPTPGGILDSWTYFTPSLVNTSSFDDSTSYTPTTTVTDYGSYSYVLQERLDGCLTYPDTVEINYVQVQNTIDISINKDTVCIPEAVLFTNNSDMTFFDSVYWEFGDGSFSNSQGTATHTYNAFSCFDVRVTLVNALGCRVDSVFPDLICGYPTPVADFVYDPAESIIPNTLVNFTNRSTGATRYLWDFAGLANSSNQDDFYIFPKTDGGVYPITLFVDNEGGCSDQITKNVTIKNPLSIWIPNSFTPNEDGLNDKFRVVFNNSSVEEYEVFIFNRWGELLFKSQELDFEWDGTYNGQEAPAGVYVWRIVGKEQFSTESFEKTGHVTLTR